MHSFQKILRTDDMNNFHKCGEILVAAKYNIFAMNCCYCQTKFTLYQAFIRHLQRHHCTELKFGKRENIELCAMEKLMTTVQQTTVEYNISKESGWTEDDENWLTDDDKKWLDEGVEDEDVEKDKFKHNLVNKSILNALKDCDVRSNLLDNLSITNCGENEDNIFTNTVLREIQNDWNTSDEEYRDKNLSQVEGDMSNDFDADITMTAPCITSTRNEDDFNNCLNSKCAALKDLMEGLDDLKGLDSLLENLEGSLIENPIVNKDLEVVKLTNTKKIIEDDENLINLNSDLKTIISQRNLEDSIMVEPESIIESLGLQLTNLEEHVTEETNTLINKSLKDSDKSEKKLKEIPLKATLNDVLIKALEEALEDDLNFLNLGTEEETDSPLSQDLRDLLEQELMEDEIEPEIKNESANKLNSITQKRDKESLLNLKETMTLKPLISHNNHNYSTSNDTLNSSLENDKIGQQNSMLDQELMEDAIEPEIENVSANKLNFIAQKRDEDSKTRKGKLEDFNKRNIQRSNQLNLGGLNDKSENKLFSPEPLTSKTREKSQENAEDFNSQNEQKTNKGITKGILSSREDLKPKTPERTKEIPESIMSNSKLLKTCVKENPKTELKSIKKECEYKFTPNSIFIKTERGNRTPLKHSEIFLKQSLEIEENDNYLETFTPTKDEKTLKIKEQTFLKQIEKIQGKNIAPTSDITIIRQESTLKTRKSKALKQSYKKPEINVAHKIIPKTIGKPNLRSSNIDQKKSDLKRNKLNFANIKPKPKKLIFSPKTISPVLKNVVIKLLRLTPNKLKEIYNISQNDSISNQLKKDSTKLPKLNTKANEKVTQLNTEKKYLRKSSKGNTKTKSKEKGSPLKPENKDIIGSLKAITKAKKKEVTLTAATKDLPETLKIIKKTKDKNSLSNLEKIVLTKSSKINTNLTEKDSFSNLENKDTTKPSKTNTKVKEKGSPTNFENMELTKSPKHLEYIHNIPINNLQSKRYATRRTTRKASIDIFPNQNNFSTKSSSIKNILKHSNLDCKSSAINCSAHKKEISHRMPHIKKQSIESIENVEEITNITRKNKINISNVSILPRISPEIMTYLTRNLQQPLPNTADFAPTAALSTKNLNNDAKQSKPTIETQTLDDEMLIKKSLKRSATSPLIGDGKIAKRPHRSPFKDVNSSNKALTESNENYRDVEEEVMESLNIDSSNILDDLLQQVANECEMNEEMNTHKTEVADKITKSTGLVNDFDKTKDLILLSKFGLNIFKSPKIEDIITFEEINEMHEKAKKFAEIYKNYKILWTPKNIINANIKLELVESIHQFLTQLNQIFDLELTVIEIRRLINLITFWYAQRWNRKLLDKDKISDGTNRYLLMFYYLPRKSKRVYYCEYCDEYFNVERYYFTHRAIHTGDQYPLKCSICLLGFKILKDQKLHEQNCAITFNRKILPENQLNTAAQLKKPLLKYSYSSLKPTTNYLLCPVCLEVFETSNLLYEHTKTHVKNTYGKKEPKQIIAQQKE